jgi:hypothetical protein
VIARAASRSEDARGPRPSAPILDHGLHVADHVVGAIPRRGGRPSQPGVRSFGYKKICACTAGWACSCPSAPASVERCRVRGSDHLGDRRDSVQPPVVEAAAAAGRNRHTPWAGGGGGHALRTLGSGQAPGRDLASPLGGRRRAWSPCPHPLSRGAHPPRRARAGSLALRLPSIASTLSRQRRCDITQEQAKGGQGNV